MTSIPDGRDRQQLVDDADSVPAEESTAAPPGTALENSHPTHRLKAIKAGVNAVQFLVSSKDHLYDVEDMEGGDGVWQAVGVWEDATIQEGIRALRQRQQEYLQSQQTNNPSGKFQNSTGQRLGSLSSGVQHGTTTK